MTTETEDRDVVDILTADHREFLALTARVLEAGSPQERRDLADTAIAEVVRHAVAEEMYVYPAIEKYLPNGKEEAEHDREEHAELEEIMKQIEAADADDPQFLALVRTMHENLDHHIEEEERDQFPQLRASIPREELVEMGRKVERAKKVAPTRPHPNAPNAELFHKMVGPGVGMIDRLRDKLSGRSTEA
jgi:hypothetical protein